MKKILCNIFFFTNSRSDFIEKFKGLQKFREIKELLDQPNKGFALDVWRLFPTFWLQSKKFLETEFDSYFVLLPIKYVIFKSFLHIDCRTICFNQDRWQSDLKLLTKFIWSRSTFLFFSAYLIDNLLECQFLQ